MSDACWLVAAVVVFTSGAAWVAWVTASVLEEKARQRRARWVAAVLARSQDFEDTSVANHTARFLKRAAERGDLDRVQLGRDWHVTLESDRRFYEARRVSK